MKSDNGWVHRARTVNFASNHARKPVSACNTLLLRVSVVFAGEYDGTPTVCHCSKIPDRQGVAFRRTAVHVDVAYGLETIR